MTGGNWSLIACAPNGSSWKSILAKTCGRTPTLCEHEQAIGRAAELESIRTSQR